MKRQLLLLIVLLPMHLLCHGQEVSENPQITSPDMWSFMKYGNTPVSLNTGTVQANIPVYTYKDQDFEIPISISYASNGYMPNVQAGSLGLGWYLNAGGAIIRSVRGIPDEVIQNNPKDAIKYPTGGYYDYYQYRQNNSNEPPTAGYTISIQNYVDFIGLPFPDVVYDLGNQKYSEMASDIFSFNFMNHKGKFTMNEGNVDTYNTTSPHGEYTVDLSGFRKTDNSKSYIEITTGDGYKYRFGGTGAEEQGSYSSGTVYNYGFGTGSGWQNLDQYQRENQPTSTWPLTKITAPNGRTVSLEYGDAENITTYQQGGMYYMGTGSNARNYCSVGGTSIKQLKSITIDGHCKIELTYGERPYSTHEEGPSTYHDPWDMTDPNKRSSLSTSKCLNEIVARSIFPGQTHEIKRASLEYYQSENVGHPYSSPEMVLMLKSVSITGEGKYEMDYYDRSSDFPFHGTSSMDYWGYLNRSSSYSYDYMQSSHSFRKPDFQAAMKGMLMIMKYPTRGFSIFQYEGHDADKMVHRTAATQYLPGLVSYYNLNNTNEVGGVRIKRIIDYSDTELNTTIFPYDPPLDDELCTYREFSYKDYLDNSSGNLLHWPILEVAYYFNINGTSGSMPYSSPWDLFTYSYSNTHIEYGRVVESRNDGSSIEYLFYNYNDIPDDITIYGMARVPQSFEFDNDRDQNLNRPFHSMHTQRGMLKAKTEYNSSGARVHSEIYNYDTDAPLRFTKSIMHRMPLSIFIPSPIRYEQRTFTSDYPIASTNETWYFGSDSLRSETSYEYNTLGQLIASTTTDNRNDVHTDRIQYVTDIPSAQRQSVHNTMIAKNVIKHPVRTQSKVKRNGIDTGLMLLGGVLNEFAIKAGNVIVMARQRKTELDNPIACGDFAFDSYLAPSSQYTYDDKGNIIQSTDPNGVPTTYIWGYGGAYLVAIVENVAIGSVTNAHTSLRSISTTPITGALSAAAETALRNLSGAMATTCDYLPLVGMTRQTDPSGRTTRYSYHPDGKLAAIRDDNNNTVQEYLYNIEN